MPVSQPVNAHAFTNASLGICVCNPGQPAALHWTGERAGAWRETLLTGYYALYDKVQGTTGGAELIGTVEHHAFNLALVFMIGLVFQLVPMLSRLIPLVSLQACDLVRQPLLLVLAILHPEKPDEPVVPSPFVFSYSMSRVFARPSVHLMNGILEILDLSCSCSLCRRCGL